jgi:hypothetical protein
MLRLIVFLLLVAYAQVTYSQENYCKDQQVNNQWLEMMANNPQDPDLIKLVALRMGLCVMVDQDLISFDKAATIFETERVEAIDKRRPTEPIEHHDSAA